MSEVHKTETPQLKNKQRCENLTQCVTQPRHRICKTKGEKQEIKSSDISLLLSW